MYKWFLHYRYITMVDLTRRKTILGLGLLATGSGATFTSATFQSTAPANSDLRVLVEQQGGKGPVPDTVAGVGVEPVDQPLWVVVGVDRDDVLFGVLVGLVGVGSHGC